jgi:hypothetical protein
MTDFEGYFPEAKSPYFLELDSSNQIHVIENGVPTHYFENSHQNTSKAIKINIGAEPAGKPDSPNLN